MGKIKQGILGAVSGKVGSVVGSSWKGIATLRSRAASVANPKTAPQVAARTRFTAIVQFASAILAEIVKPLWDRFAQQESGYNAFIKRNYLSADDGGLIDPALIVTSQGKMTGTAISSVTTNTTDDEVEVFWTDDSGQGFKLATDVAYITIFNVTQNKVVGYGSTGATRADEVALLIDRTMVVANNLYVYLSFRRADGTIVSDSTYLQKTV